MERHITDSGVFDLAQLSASIEPAPLHEKHDDSLLGIGSAPLPPPKRESRESRVKPKLIPAMAFLAMFGSVAFALHTSLRAVELAEASNETFVEPDIVDSSVLADGVAETEAGADADTNADADADAESESEANVADDRSAPVRVTRRAPVSTPPDPTPAVATLGERSVDELMRLATGLPQEPTGAPRASADAPPMRTLQPARSEVARVFRALTPAVQRCAPDGEGIVTARVYLIGATGRARTASVTGAEGSVATCMEQALLNAEVEPFLQDRLEITFPYRL